jgi:spore coat protein A, manganese oxidase
LSPTRRTFLQQASAFGLLSHTIPTLAQQMMHDHMAPMAASSDHVQPPPVPMLHTLALTPFVDPLPLPQRAQSLGHHAGPQKLRIGMREIHAKVHRDVPATRLWTYCDLAPHGAAPSSLAPLIEARSGQPLEVEWVNDLPTRHFLPIDYTLHGCGHDLPDVRAIVHLHGACAPTRDDGYPEDWFVPGASRTCRYPMQQDAATLWYHDHAMGLNRLNIYAGLVGMAFLRDRTEDSLGLPTGKYEVPLTLFDRDFSADGQLFYPTSGDPDHPWVSEFYADGILINGKIRPFFEVEPRLYRFRVLNAANSRFFTLSLTHQQPFQQIGSDQGLLAAPVPLTRLDLGPAERADLLIDFSQSAGQHLHLANGAFDILEFRVAPSTPNPARSIPTQLRTINRIPEPSAILTRTITLHDYRNGLQNSMLMLLNGKHWHEPVTERPRLNTTEIWEFVNLTEDVHPMHLHLVRFQILDRRVFDVFAYQTRQQLRFLSPATPPDPNERGWKDTVQCPPGTITRIIVPFEGYPGKYLYHCHILEHESNDMMRPFEVLA